MSETNVKHEHDIGMLYNVAELFGPTGAATAIDESDLVAYLNIAQDYSEAEAQWAIQSMQRSGKLNRLPKLGNEENAFVRKGS